MVGLTDAGAMRTRCLLALLVAPSVLGLALPQELIETADNPLLVRCEPCQISPGRLFKPAG